MSENLKWLIELGRRGDMPHDLLLDRATTELAALRAERDALKSELTEIKNYFEEHHANRIAYPEFIEFYFYKNIVNTLGLIVPAWELQK